MANFMYILVDHKTKDAVVIDPCWDVQGIVNLTKQMGVNFSAAYFTEVYYPRAYTGGQLVQLEGIKDVLDSGCSNVGVGELDVKAVCEQSGISVHQIQALQEGDVLTVGRQACLSVIHTPGHTPGSVTFQLSTTNHGVESHQQARPVALFTGDTLFIGSSGRTDLPESNPKHILESLAKLAQLPDSVLVFPGHNYARPTQSTIGREKAGNFVMIEAMQSCHMSHRGFTPSTTALHPLLPDYLSAVRLHLEQRKYPYKAATESLLVHPHSMDDICCIAADVQALEDDSTTVVDRTLPFFQSKY